MPATTSADRPLYAELIGRGLPTEYAARTADELDDHRADLLAELRSAGVADAEVVADERLGEPRTLAKKIAHEYRQRSLFGRWPLISFLLGPIPLLIAAWVVGYLPIALVGAVFEMLDFSRPSVLVQSVLGHSALLWVLVIVPALVAYGWSRLALRKTCNRGYVLSVCGVLAMFVGGSFCAELRTSPIPGEGKLLVSSPAIVGDSTGSIVFFQHPKQLIQYAAPLIAGGLVLWSDRRRRRAALLASPDSRSLRLAA